jgi:G:T-mismatch repair DNA endonuclease (very short patch repair protein)
MIRIKLTDGDINEIINLYISGELSSTHKLATKFKVGHKKISKILKDNNISINSRGGQIRDGVTNELINTRVKEIKVSSNDKKLIAICKLNGRVFNDAMNRSGILTSHIIEHYKDVNIPTNTYQRKKHELKYDEKWYEEYFTIKEVDKCKIRKCSLCDWETVDVENITGCFEKHIKGEHLISLESYLTNFPNERGYHKIFNKNRIRKSNLNNINKSVTCAICGEKMYVISNTHLAKHKISGYEYKLKYSGKLMNSDLILNTAKRLSTYNLSDNIKRNQTKPEIEIGELLSSLGVNFTTSNRSILNGKEIDILIDDIKLGIEFNGNIHHTESFGGKDRKYHINKTIGANNNGYNLIHIFSDEWRNKRDIVINKLTNLVRCFNGVSLGGRQCKIKEIQTTLKNEFLDTYHIQGHDSSTIKLGAFLNDELVGVMTFSDKRNGVYDLSRFATNYSYKISGLGSKMLKHFIKNYEPKSIISFADRRWTLNSENNLYVKMGFKLINTLKPDYRYYHPNNHTESRDHKFGFRKQILTKKYPNKLDMSMTEGEMVKILGYDKIWDCGLFKYELKINDQ